MEDCKIFIGSEADSKQAQELFFNLGFTWSNNNSSYLELGSGFNFITAYSDEMCIAMGHGDADKEITLPELRDLVVLKRNDVGDANYTYCGKPVLKLETQDYKVWNKLDKCWVEHIGSQTDLRTGLKPIEKKEMKEYLDKQQDGTYKLIKASSGCIDRDWIEIPKGAQVYAVNNGYHYFFSSAGIGFEWSVLWQRNQEPKQAEFLVKTDSGYVLQVLDENAGGVGVVRIPDGAEIAVVNQFGFLNIYKNINGILFYFNPATNGSWLKSSYGINGVIVWKRETLNDQVTSAEEYREMISNAASVGLTSVVTDIAQSCGGGSGNASSQGQSDFPLNNYELNHRVAKAFNAVRGTDLNEDDVNYLRELINLTISHYGERK